ncbi:MAG: sugar phosphate isomerase/epimerase [Anaerolineales bacterium]|nr:sugar phosphate isomerase/epimerase [Anaerolineales bacterium]
MGENEGIYPGLGLVHYVSFPKNIPGDGPIIENLESILADDDFQTIEISWIKNEDVKKKASALLKTSGKRIVFSGGPPFAYQQINLSSLDDGERKYSMEYARQLFDDARLFNACIFLITGGRDTLPSERERAKDKLVQSIVELSKYAREHSDQSPIYLSLEPVDRAVHRKGLIGPIAEAVEIAQRVEQAGETLYLTLDQSHLAQLGIAPGEALRLAYNYLFHVHLANCIICDPQHPLYGDEHPYFGIKDGEHGLQELVVFLKILEKLGYFSRQPPYGGWPIVSVEVKPLDNEDPVEALKTTKAVLAKSFAETCLSSLSERISR